MRRLSQTSPTFIVFVFVIVVLVLQLAYLILVRPAPVPHSPVKRLNGYDYVAWSTVRSYKPIKLHELLSHRKDDKNSITLIFLDEFGIKLAQNFIRECDKVNLNNYVIFSLDNYTTCEKLGGEHICFFDQAYNFTTEHSRISYKINITLYLVRQGYNIFSTHKDILLSDNPLLYFDRSVDVNVLNEYPTSFEKAKKDPAKCCNSVSKYYDAGFYFIRSTRQSIIFLENFWRIYSYSSNQMSSSDAFNTALSTSQIQLKLLSDIQFPNGFIAFWMARPRIEPVAIHLNWGDINTKIYRARELLHWNLDDAERYSAPRQYITYISEDDSISFQVERDHLLLAYMVAKILNRNLILPKFHCYIDQPASCLLDSVFDPALTRELDVYENAFLQSDSVPEEHLRKATLSLPDLDSTTTTVTTMKELLFQLEGFDDVPLLEIEFPKMTKDGRHYALSSISDRRAKWDHDLFVNQVEKSVRFSEEVFGNWTNFLPPFIKDEGADFACVLTVSDELEFLIKTIQKMKLEKPLYVVSDDPTRPNPSYMNKLAAHLRNKIVFGYDSLWSGHKLMAGHSALAHLQMETCIRASEVIVHTFGPGWLVGGICSARKNLKKSNCQKLLPDPWDREGDSIGTLKQHEHPQKEQQERAKIARFKHGVLAMYPEKGPLEGGNLVTFIHSPENATVEFSMSNYGGCKFGGSEIAPVTGVTKYMDAFYLVHCYAPAHAEGEVDPILLVDGEERLPFPGTIVYKYMKQDTINSLPDPFLAACTVFKNNARYIREWITFHYMLGVKKFYLYDQGSTEDWKFAVADYIEKGIIEYYEWDLFLKPSTRMQTAALWHCIQNHHEISWMLLTDLDEFLVPVQYKKEKNFSIILHEFDNSDIAQIYVDRVNYGPSGHVDRPKGLVIENYNWREPITYSPVKSIVRPKFVVDTICGGVHTFKVQDGRKSTDIARNGREEPCGRTRQPELKRLRINHYWSKSVEDFNEKLSWDDNPYRVSPDELLQQWTNVVEDKIMEKFVFKLKKLMDEKV